MSNSIEQRLERWIKELPGIDKQMWKDPVFVAGCLTADYTIGIEKEVLEFFGQHGVMKSLSPEHKEILAKTLADKLDLQGMMQEIIYPALGLAVSAQLRNNNPWHPLLTAFSNIEERAVDWLWYPYLPLGRLSILEGDPGQGKSWFSMAVAASLSHGGWPFLINGEESIATPSNTIYLTTEDDPSDTVKKRLNILGADQGKIYYLHGKTKVYSQTIASITLADIHVLDEAISSLSAKLVIVDPIQAHLPARVDMNKAEDVRPVLAALHALAHRRRCAVLLIRHFSKGVKEKVIYQGMGSIDFAAAARSVLICGEVGEKEYERLSFKRIFAVIQTKNNLAPRGLAIEFELRRDEFGWVGGTERTIASLFSSPGSGEIEEAKTFLWEILSEGPTSVETVRRQARQIGLDSKVLIEAKMALKIKNEKTDSGFAWRLPYEERGH